MFTYLSRKQSPLNALCPEREQMLCSPKHAPEASACGADSAINVCSVSSAKIYVTVKLSLISKRSPFNQYLCILVNNLKFLIWSWKAVSSHCFNTEIRRGLKKKKFQPSLNPSSLLHSQALFCDMGSLEHSLTWINLFSLFSLLPSFFSSLFFSISEANLTL